MTIVNAIYAGVAADELSKKICGSERGVTRTTASTILGYAGGAALGMGATALSAALAPAAIPLAVIGGGIGFIKSIFD